MAQQATTPYSARLPLLAVVMAQEMNLTELVGLAVPAAAVVVDILVTPQEELETRHL